MDWLDRTHAAIYVEESIRKAFTTCGLYDSRNNGMIFVEKLNHRLKQILFIDQINYDQNMKLCYLSTFAFSSIKVAFFGFTFSFLI